MILFGLDGSDLPDMTIVDDGLAFVRLRVGMTREQVIAIFGEPPEKGGTSRKYRTPSVFRYGRTEFHFQPWKAGGLVWVQEVDENGSFLRRIFPLEKS